MLALKLSSIMVMAAMHLHTIFMGVSPRSQLGCLTRQSHYLPSFFINRRCPPSDAPGVLATDHEVNIKDELLVKCLPVAKEGLHVQSDSPTIVVEENEEPNAANGS